MNALPSFSVWVLTLWSSVIVELDIAGAVSQRCIFCFVVSDVMKRPLQIMWQSQRLVWLFPIASLSQVGVLVTRSVCRELINKRNNLYNTSLGLMEGFVDSSSL